MVITVYLFLKRQSQYEVYNEAYKRKLIIDLNFSKVTMVVLNDDCRNTQNTNKY